MSFERLAINRLRDSLSDLTELSFSQGMAITNRFAVDAWELPVLQHFQFGDLRIETPKVTVVIEVESAGGITNVVKYWPLLGAGVPRKRFVLIHLFRITTPGDYQAHRRLWEYVVERMREDLQRRGVRWPEHWEAHMQSYGQVEDVDAVVPLIREALS